ncbi:hypothetical protein B0H19DRAFT_492445 [Mycena capillaripes]|nr:hypothetical protein B0H19DRAFT_492445 [Mycena capillaripes]
MNMPPPRSANNPRNSVSLHLCRSQTLPSQRARPRHLVLGVEGRVFPGGDQHLWYPNDANSHCADNQRNVYEAVYFDLAGACMPSQIHRLLLWSKSDRLVYGSDAPWTPYESAEKLAQAMEADLPKFNVSGDQEIRSIYEGNAARLLTRISN